MTGVLLETICSPPSPERNQMAPRTARTSAAAARATAIRGGAFRGGGESFLIDLFLDFLPIEMTPCESSFEPKPHSAPYHPRHSQRLKRRARDGVSFVEQVLHRDECFDVPGERSRDRHVENREAVQRQAVLVIVELFARGAELHCGGDESRVRIDGLERELMAGNLRNPQAFES